MRYQIEVDTDKEKEFLQIMEALQRLRVIKSIKVKSKAERKGAEKEPKKEVSSREMASQYRDLVD